MLASTVALRHGGACRTSDLERAGLSRRAIASAVKRGEIERLRRGAFAHPGIATDLKRAIRVGGRLACVSAAQLHGLRLLHPPGELHVLVDAHSTRLRHPLDSGARLVQGDPSVRLHWSERGMASTVSPALVPLVECLAQMLVCLPDLDALCAIDAARERVDWRADHPQLLDDLGFERLLEALPVTLRRVAERSVTGSQAIGETVARERFRTAGIPARAQVPLPGGYWADLLIGDRLVFEVDGEGPHMLPGQFDRDRSRWGWLKAIGYVHLSYSHTQVLHDWESIENVVRMLMRQGAHLAR
ncbi:MAG TPA: type IV toxin-antitoxin system AbiEi family antitoxin domain-containing protein [Agromyces sp.]